MHAKKTAFVVEHDFIMATYLADRCGAVLYCGVLCGVLSGFAFLSVLVSGVYIYILCVL
jgi:hypothetical protein